MLSLILKEISFRKWHTAMMLCGLISVTALITAYLSTESAAERETKRVARDLGFNLRILPKQTNMDLYWFQGFSDQTMPEGTVKTGEL
jgi:putative ABC transport system permease protein